MTIDILAIEEERFWSMIDRRGPDECWLWTRATTLGYGRFRVWRTRKSFSAHRVAYELANGPIPEGDGYHGTCVCHRCDNRRCCNPAHLFAGAQLDNMRDMAAKGRRAPAPHHEGHYAAKLTVEQVKEIRRLHETGGLPSRALGEMFGVSRWSIRAIVSGKTWNFQGENKP